MKTSNYLHINQINKLTRPTKMACRLIGMQGAIDPVLRERSEIMAMNIKVDKYKEQVSFGKMPFEIILRKDGDVFDAWGPEDGMPTIDTPKVSESDRHILGGTFWGWTKGEAIEEAQNLLQAMKEAGDI